MQESQEQYYTTHEVSKFCNVYPTTVINWINEGMLPAFTTPGGHRRIAKNNLIDLMKKNKMPLPQELLESEKIRILAIDDDAKILKMIRSILEAEPDVEVATAKDGFEAGIILADFEPDIVLLDILMPKIDGFEVCRRIRNGEKTKDIPVIAVTVLRTEKDIKKMKASGMTDHLAKPFKSRELIEKVRKYTTVSQRRAR